MAPDDKTELARIPKAVQVTITRDLTPALVQGLEAALVEFLRSKSGAKLVVPAEKRVFLTLPEAAEFTGLPASFLRRLISEGTLRALRTGGGWRIPRAGCESLAEKLMQPPATREELTPAAERDFERNKLRRLGLLPPEDLKKL